MITVTASREQTRIIQAWFGLGNHAFDATDVKHRTFTSSEVRQIYEPTYNEFGETKLKCANTLWDLYSQAMSTTEAPVEKFTVKYTTDYLPHNPEDYE